MRSNAESYIRAIIGKDGVGHYLREAFHFDNEALLLYFQSHNVFLRLSPVIAVVLVLFKFRLYGVPLIFEYWLIIVVLISIGVFFYYKQLVLHDKITIKGLQDKNGGKVKVNSIVIFDLVVNKACYSIAWLTFLFLPINSSLFYDHLLGFVYVFCIIAVYPSISSSVWLLFVCDVSIHLIFVLFVTVYNFGVQETPMAGLVIIVFSVYSFLIGKKLNNASKEMFQSKAKLQRAVENAQHAHDAKTDFLAVMSHEIRTPMNGIIGMIDFLKETKMTSEQSQCINTIDECSGSLINTLNDVLDYSKIEAGKFDIRPRNFDLQAWIDHVSSMFRQKAKQSNNIFNVYVAEDVPHSIFSDANRLQQIAVNLLNNAFKFTKDGIINFSVKYVEKDLGGFIRMEIKDTGEGITQKDQRKLFKKYSQVGELKTASEMDTNNKGTGLGLSIAQRLVNIMGGHIGVRSVKGQGSLFWFEIPYNLPVNVESDERSKKVSYKNSPDKYYVLLVDDNKINQQIVTRHLINKGHKVLQAHSGEQAVQYVQQGHSFDAILMDLHMVGGIDGIETTKRIRENYPTYKNVPIIAITANLMENSLKKCYSAGMIDHIAKPVDKDDLFMKLYHNVSKQKQGKQKVELQAEPEELQKDNEELKKPLEPDFRMRRKYDEFCEEFGEDYAHYIIQSSLDEVSSLIEGVKMSFAEDDILRLLSFTHDLISVSGNVGMAETSKISVQIEDGVETTGRQIKANDIKWLIDVAMNETHLLMALISK